MITSTANKQVKNIIQLAKDVRERRSQGVFLAEGLRLFLETPPGSIQSAFVSEAFLQKPSNLEAVEEKGIGYEAVSDPVFRRMSDTQAPQGILCIVRQPEYALEDLLREEPLHLLVLENIQDPGNLGTMFRTAEGAGASGIIMDRACADIFAPKTVRSTMGSIYRVPFYVGSDLKEVAGILKQRQVTLYAAHLKSEGAYDTFDYRGNAAFLIGNEGNGLTRELADCADVRLRIPMEGKLESLNAAMAAGILMYEVNRQRRQETG